LLQLRALDQRHQYLIVPLEEAFGWGRDQISLAISVNVLLYGLTAPFAAALMERFTVRKVVMACAYYCKYRSFSDNLMYMLHWQLVLTWGVIVGVGTGSMALVFAATVANRWFVKRRGLVAGGTDSGRCNRATCLFAGPYHFVRNIMAGRSIGLTIGSASLLMVPFIYFFLREKPSDRRPTSIWRR